MSRILKAIVNEVNPQNYDSDIDYYNALNRKPRSRAEPDYSEPEDPYADTYRKQDAEMSKYKKEVNVQYANKEGVAPNGERYNGAFIVRAKNSQQGDNEIYKFNDAHWGAKKIVDTVKKQPDEQGEPYTTIVYYVDNHKHGYWKPWKDEPPISKGVEFGEEIMREGISQEDLADTLFHRLELRYPDVVKRYGHEVVGDIVLDVAGFHEGAEELGTSDISIMLRQIMRKLEEYANEQINELSPQTLASYKQKAGADASKSDRLAQVSRDIDDHAMAQKLTNRANKRFSGIVRATKKQFANDSKKVKEDKWNPITGGDFPTDYTSGDTTPSPAKFQAMLDYHGNNINVIRALEDLYRNAQSGSYYDSTVRADRYLATIENRFGKSEKRYFPTKREAYQYAKGYNSVVTSIEKIDKEEDTSDLITLPVMLGIKDHKKKWMLKFPSEDYAQKWEFKHKNVAKILWDEQHALYTPEPEAKPETEKDQEDDEPGKYGYDTETGKPLKKGEKSSRPQQGNRPQQASRPQQYNTSQQVGYTPTKPSKPNKDDDVTDVEPKPNKPLALGNSLKENSSSIFIGLVLAERMVMGVSTDASGSGTIAEEDIDEDWQKTNKKDKTDGMSRKAVKAYRRENPGSKLKTAVTTKPSKLKKGSKSAKRRKSFCARMSGMKKSRASAKTKRDPDSPINKALRRWNCESVEQLHKLMMIAEQKVQQLREAANPAQQAAIAISMKKKGQKPKQESAIEKGIVDENLGMPYPGTYEQETAPFKRTSQQQRVQKIAFEGKK